MIAARPTPTFAAPAMAEPIAALPQDELAAVRVQRPIPQSSADIAGDNLQQQQARVMTDKDKNPILNALKGFGLRFLQTKGGLMERIGGGAFGAVENTLLPDAQGARGTVDERFMQGQKIAQAQGAYNSAAQLEKDQIERETRAADLQHKAMRPFIDTEKIRTKDEATEQRARSAQARIEAAARNLEIKLGTTVKPVSDGSKMWHIVNKPDANGKLVPSLQPMIHPETGAQFDDPKVVIAAENNATRQKIAAGRNATTTEVAQIRAGATKYTADSNAQMKRETLAAQLRNQLASRKITIAQLKVKLDIAVAEGKLTQSQADAAYVDATH